MGLSPRFFLVVAMLVAPDAAAARTVIAGGHVMTRGASGRIRAGNQNQVTNRYNQNQVTDRYSQEQVTDRYNGVRDGRRGRDIGGFGGGGLGDFGIASTSPQGPIPVRGVPPLPPLGGLFPPPPRCPLIIKIGRGLSHPAKTEVVSGSPFCADR